MDRIYQDLKDRFVVSIVIYTKGTDGHDLCFAFLTSEMSVLDAHVLQKKLCLRLVGGT